MTTTSPRLQRRGLQGFQTGIERFKKAGFLETHIIRYCDGSTCNDPVHDPDIGGEAAAGGFESGGCAGAAIMGTL